ncbi:MAG: fuconate dehydratase [Verrucomicrobiales bacterium]|nr:fuconate dehydratase [Verrucomicrobiales bacterium]|tara:strand:- start:6307 stop:7602 length:1296 start_codon:yes stop_codon:yes gene_type:complete
MSLKIEKVEAHDVRFPTSRSLDGSDAMNPDPDYSAAYVILKTNDPELEGHGLTFTIGRGNELCVAAVDALKYLVEGIDFRDFTSNPGRFWGKLTGDSQLRWLGPDKGVLHLATGAVVNALWDLWAKAVKKPLWKLLSDLSPEQLVSCVDFRYITDALTPQQAVALLQDKAAGKEEREKNLLENGYPAYTTSAGWLGYPDDKIRRLCREAIADGWDSLKIKVGSDMKDDIRRCEIIREEIGWDRKLMVDANQVWEVNQAIAWMKMLAKFKPHWIEEPTSPDDIGGHQAIAQAIDPIKVATGEHCQNRIMFKQFMQAEAIEFCQIDACRVGGVNEVLAIILLAARFGIPVCPHGGGVGLCEYVQHLAMFDYIAVSGTQDDRMIEYVDHLHEHFHDPCVLKNGCYQAPSAPGYSITMKTESIDRHRFPDGVAWK